MVKLNQLLLASSGNLLSMLRMLMVLVTLLCLASCASRLSSQHTTITLLHTNDTHSHLESFTPSEEPEQGGVARRKTMIESIRSEVGADQVVLVDAGDFFQGTTFYNAWQGSADIMALNELGYDVVTLGNHEFDRGPVALARALNGGAIEIAGSSYASEALRPLLVATNLDVAAEPDLVDKIQRSVILDKKGAKIAVLGAMTPLLSNISQGGTTIVVDDVRMSIQTEIDHLIAQGIDKIILLSHVGYQEDIALAKQLSGLDVVVCAHDHALLLPESAYSAGAPLEYLAEQVDGDYPTVISDEQGYPVLLVGAYEWGKLLGRIDITFDSHGHISNWSGEPIAISADIAADIELAEQVARYKEPISAFSNVVIGEIDTYFAGERMPGVRSQEMPLGNLVSDAILAVGARCDSAVAALINGGMLRSSLPQSVDIATSPPYSVTFGDLLSLLPFGNSITTLDVTGNELVMALDKGLTWAFDSATMTARSSGAFPQVSGLRLTYCRDTVADMRNQINPPASCPGALVAGGVVTSLQVAGSAVDLAATYRIATVNFLTNGGDYYQSFQQACTRADGHCVDSGILALDALSAKLASSEPVVGVVEERIVGE